MDKSTFNKTDIFINKSQIIEKDGKFGLIDSVDNILIKCKFNEVKQFKNGFQSIIKVRIENLWGVLNDKGELIIQCNYNDVFPIWSHEIFLAKQGNKWGSINKKEEPISGFILDECYDEYSLPKIRFEDVNDKNRDILYFRKALIRNIDKDTNYEDGYDRGLIASNSGEIILSPKFYNFDSEFTNNILRVWKTKNQVGAIDVHGNEIVPCEYQDVQAFGNGNILVKSNDIWRFFNVQIELSDLTDLIHIDKDLKFAKQSDKWGLINSFGEILIPFEYDDANSTSLKKGKYWYLVDFKSNKVTDCNYESKFEYRGNTSIYFKDGYFGDYSNFEVKVPFEIEDIEYSGLDSLYNNIKINGKWGLICGRKFFSTAYGNFLLNCEYDYPIINEISNFEYSRHNNNPLPYIFKLYKNSKVGFAKINPNADEVKIIFDCTFENGDILDKDLLIVKHEETGNKWLKIDISNGSSQTIEEFDDWNNGLVRKGNKWSILGKEEYIYSTIKPFEGYGFFAENGSKWDLIKIEYSYNSKEIYQSWRGAYNYTNAYLKCGKNVVVSEIESWQFVDKHVALLTSKDKKGMVSSNYKVKDIYSNYNNEQIFLECIYDKIEYNYSENYTLLLKNSYYSIFSHQNAKILESKHKYFHISNIINGYAIVKRKNIVSRGLWGKKIENEYFGILKIKETETYEQIKCEYDSIELTKENKVIVQKQNKKAVIDFYDYDTFMKFSL